MIWKQIQTVKRSKEDLHVVWPDPANAFSIIPIIPHSQLIACARLLTRTTMHSQPGSKRLQQPLRLLHNSIPAADPVYQAKD